MSDSVDISGLDKVELLKALWENQKVASFFSGMPQEVIPKWDYHGAREAIARGKIDYHQGRNIKMDLRGDSVASTKYYDEDAPVAAAVIVERLRAKQ